MLNVSRKGGGGGTQLQILNNFLSIASTDNFSGSVVVLHVSLERIYLTHLQPTRTLEAQ